MGSPPPSPVVSPTCQEAPCRTRLQRNRQGASPIWDQKGDPSEYTRVWRVGWASLKAPKVALGSENRAAGLDFVAVRAAVKNRSIMSKGGGHSSKSAC